MMNFEVPNFLPAAAEIFMAIMVLVILMVTTFAKNNARKLAYGLTQLTLLITLVIVYLLFDGKTELTFSSMYIHDPFGGMVNMAICLFMLAALVYGHRYLSDRKLDRPEIYLLMLLMTLGMMVMVTGYHFLTLYIGLELMSLALYGIIAFDRKDLASTEAALKYFVLGALASGLLLYGMSMIYGATHGLQLNEIAQAITLIDLSAPTQSGTLLALGLVFILAGIAFKLGVVPFHMWVPDVYQGSKSFVTLVISTVPKVAVFAMLVRVLLQSMIGLIDQWQIMLAIIACLSIVLGNFAAIKQTNIKRMLAYSGISHMGFVLTGLLASFASASSSVSTTYYSAGLFYVLSYVIMGLAAFSVILALSDKEHEAVNLEDFMGLNQRSRLLAIIMLVSMFSMAGVPFFIGFFAKLSVLQVLINHGYMWLAIVAVVMSVIGAFYYLRVVKLMYFDKPNTEMSVSLNIAWDMKTVMSINGLLIAFLMFAHGGFLDICEKVITQLVITPILA